MKPESDRLAAAAAAAAAAEEEEGKAKAASVESPPVSESRGELGLVGVPPSLLPPDELLPLPQLRPPCP